MGSKKSGRRLRLTKETHEIIVRALKAGAFKVVAAAAAGISEDTLREWLRRGKKGEKEYVAFFRDVEKVVAEDCIRNQAFISKAAMSDWKAAAWNLERKYPKLYARPAAPALGMTIAQSTGSGEDGGEDDNRTRIQFYLPDNGRRPDAFNDDDADEEA